MVALDHHSFHPRGSAIRRKISLLCMSEPVAERMYRKKSSAQPDGTAQNGMVKGRCDSLVLRKRPDYQPFLVFLMQIPIAGPQFQSALVVSCSYLAVPRVL